MPKIIKAAYTHIYPKWKAPSGQSYHIERYELKNRYSLFCDGVEVISKHLKSDMLLLWLLKNELGWSGEMNKPFSPKEMKNLRSLTQAFGLTYQGTFINELSE